MIALVAIVALVQPWIHGVYKRFFRKGRVEFFKAGKLAVYYGWQGHIVEIVGTLNAKFEDQFIRALSVKVVRERDSSRHNFE